MSAAMAMLVAIFLLPRPVAYSAARGEIAYRVDLTSTGAGEIEVSLSLDPESAPLVLELPDEYGNGLATGLSSHVSGEKAYDASGGELMARREGNEWYIEHEGPLTFTYNLRLGGYGAGTPYLESLAQQTGGWPYFPYLDEDAAYLPGFAVFVRPRGGEDLRPSLELEMPEGWRAVAPWGERPERLADLLENPVYAGDIALVERDSLLVAAPAGAPATAEAGLDEYADRAVSLLGKAEGSLWGTGLPAGQRLLIIMTLRGEEPAEEGNGFSGALYLVMPFSSSITLPMPRDANPLSDNAIEATARGMSSLLLSRGLYLDEEAAWLREGSAWYLQDLLPYDAGLWGASLFWDRFNLLYDAYRAGRADSDLTLASSAKAALGSAQAATLLCHGGATACASIDAGLRSLQPYAIDLPSFLRDLRELSRPEKPLGNEEIRTALENLTGRDWSSFFRQHVTGSALIPASSFSSLNITGAGSQAPEQQPPEGNTSVSGWILLVVAVVLVFLIPFVLEPYTMRPRKPGFLERELSKDE